MTKTAAPAPVQQRHTIEYLESIAHHVNVQEIDKENEFNAGYYYDAIRHEQDAYLDFQNAKIDLDTIEGQAWLATKEEEKAILAELDAKERSASKLTETDKKSHIACKPEVIAAKQRRAQTESHYERCVGLSRALSMRQKDIDNLTQMVLQKHLSFSRT